MIRGPGCPQLLGWAKSIYSRIAFNLHLGKLRLGSGTHQRTQNDYDP
jgi:hypothetical protein